MLPVIVFKVRAPEVQPIWRREDLTAAGDTTLSFPKI